VQGFNGTYGSLIGTYSNGEFSGTWYANSFQNGQGATFDLHKCDGPSSNGSGS
jgi:hypothetical protein